MATQNAVRKFATSAPTLEGVSLELALASLYDPATGETVASRNDLAKRTHYSEKRVRTLTRELGKSGRWTVVAEGNSAKRFVPSI